QTSEMEQAELRATEYKRALDFHIVNQSGSGFTSFTWALLEETADAAEDTDAAAGSSSDTPTGNSATGGTPDTDTDAASSGSGSSSAASGNSGKNRDASTGSSDASTGATKEDTEAEDNAAKGTSMRNAASQAKEKAADAASDSSTASTEDAEQEEDVLANAAILLSLPGPVPEGATLAGISVPLELADAVGHRLVLIGTTATSEQITYDLGQADKLNDAVVFSLTLLPDTTFEITSSLLN
ncbi:MAG: hypothetical protein IK096_01740, partial [Lachnospiraceae bacterium]|nr:hypothetical protein [Lachnospiraceae bacterium]